MIAEARGHRREPNVAGPRCAQATELIIFFGTLALLGVAAMIGGADSRPRIDTSHEWGLHSWDRDD